MNIITLTRHLLSIKEFYVKYLDKDVLESQNIYDVYDEDFEYMIFKNSYSNATHEAALVVVMIPAVFEHDALVFINGKFAYKRPWSCKMAADCNNRSIAYSGEYYD